MSRARYLSRTVRTLTGLAVCSVLFLPGTTQVEANDRVGRLEERLARAAQRACAERGRLAPCGLVGLSRTELGRRLVHYRMVLQVGTGPFDAVTVHRIVRERLDGVPFRTRGTFFYLHGSANDFLGTLVVEGGRRGLGLHLANRGVDVWGVDVRWVGVPRSQTDFSSFQPWDFALQVDDIRLATRFARHARALTGGRPGRLNLAGGSLGASFVYAVANAEAALPDEDRDVGGLIPIETVYKLPPGSPLRNVACTLEKNHRNAMKQGSYALNSLALIDAGARALAAPDDPSPVDPTLTNAQFALAQAAAPNFAGSPFHLFSVLTDPAGLPAAGKYTDTAVAFQLMSGSVPWRARATMLDYFALPCDTTDLAYDDHLGDVTVPVFYTGLAGGFGAEGAFVNGLLGSDDVTTNLVQLEPDGLGTEDFAHGDWWAAAQAEELVWKPIRRWILTHPGSSSDCGSDGDRRSP